jgi:putative nucleotidyltransferase with HDIG domain
MLGNIFEHSLIVTKVALYLSEALNKKGQQIDTELVEAASLLHDIAKTECLATQQDHAEAGAGLLEAMGYARVGEVVAQHIRLFKEQESSRVTEEEVVYYADKRVRHDEIVSLEERFMDLMERYGKDEKAIEQLERLKKAASETERKIFSILESDPAVLQRF